MNTATATTPPYFVNDREGRERRAAGWGPAVCALLVDGEVRVDLDASAAFTVETAIGVWKALGEVIAEVTVTDEHLTFIGGQWEDEDHAVKDDPVATRFRRTAPISSTTRDGLSGPGSIDVYVESFDRRYEDSSIVTDPIVTSADLDMDLSNGAEAQALALDLIKAAYVHGVLTGEVKR